MGYVYFRELLGWVRRWRSVPVFAWTRAASYFSRSYFESAAREYQRGLDRFPNHHVAPYARLDLSVCLERMGNYEAACEQLTILARSPGPLQKVAKTQLCYTLLLSDRGAEAGKIAESLTLDSRQLRSRHTTNLLAVKALSLFDLERPVMPERMIGRVKTTPGLNQAGRRMRSLNSREGSNRVPLRRERVFRSTGFALKSANQEDNICHTHGICQQIEELRPYRTVHELVDAVIKLSEGDTAMEEIVAVAEGKDVEGLWLWIIAGQKLLDRKEPIRARKLLKRALAAEPRSPRVLSLLARTYLVSGEGYNPDFAVQLATKACQHSGWQSARAHAVLAECFYHSGDKLAALTVVQGSRSKLADPQIQLLLESLNEQLVS